MTVQTAAWPLSLFATNGMNPATGYGKMEIGLLRGFEQIGAPVKWFTMRPHRKLPGPVLIIGNPEWGQSLPKSARRWCYTMSESTRVSAKWVDALNAMYEGVIVPCPDLVEIYRHSGVLIPVHCVPLGVDLWPPEWVPRPAYPRQFTFLTYSLGDMRKAAELVMFAFKRLFNGDPRYRLIVKARDNWRASWLAGLDDPQIEIVGGQTSEADWHGLLASAHAFIFPSRGEGFGLPPREAALSGLPVVATQWLGMWDADCWGYPLPVRDMRPAQFDFWEANAEGASWAEPDISVLDAHMREIVGHYGRALRRARRARTYLLHRFKWANTARKVRAVMGLWS